MATDTSAAPLGSPENPVKFRDQDFKSLLKECLKSRVLFSDPTFPADQKSIGMPELDLDPKKAIKWLRPKVSPLWAQHLHIVHVQMLWSVLLPAAWVSVYLHNNKAAN